MSHPDHMDAIPLAAGENPPVPGAIKIRSKDMASLPMTTRTKARKAALDILFEADLLAIPVSESLNRRIEDEESYLRTFTEDIVRGFIAHHEQIDQRISESLTGDWTLERMPRIDRNLARVAVWELDYTDIDSSAAISEALELANGLSTDDSVSYLNGLLGRAASSRPDHPLGG